MPELPDLQLFSSNLSRRLAGKVLLRIKVQSKKARTSEALFRKALEGQELKNIYREGKELRFAFGNGSILGMHLMLHGRLHFFDKKTNEKHPIVIMSFTDGTGLVLSDYQGMANPSLDPPQPEAPDALSKSLSYGYLRQRLTGSRAKIKQLLLDQHIIRGIGNAYADEILWEAGISPFSIAGKIPATAVKKLTRVIPKVLKAAEKKIRKANPDIISGEIRDFLAIHNPRQSHSPSGAVIEHKSTGGRKSYFTSEQVLFQ